MSDDGTRIVFSVWHADDNLPDQSGSRYRDYLADDLSVSEISCTPTPPCGPDANPLGFDLSGDGSTLVRTIEPSRDSDDGGRNIYLLSEDLNSGEVTDLTTPSSGDVDGDTGDQWLLAAAVSGDGLTVAVEYDQYFPHVTNPVVGLGVRGTSGHFTITDQAVKTTYSICPTRISEDGRMIAYLKMEMDPGNQLHSDAYIFDRGDASIIDIHVSDHDDVHNLDIAANATYVIWNIYADDPPGAIWGQALG
jgi:hypothetical protein